MPSPYEPSTRPKFQKPLDGKNRQLNMRVDDHTFDLLLKLKESRGYTGRTLAPFARSLLMERIQELAATN